MKTNSYNFGFFLCADEHFDNRTGNSSFDGMNKNENEVLLECSEDVPFSPLRQSYTPLPMNQSNGMEHNDDNESDENEDEDNLITADCNPTARNYQPNDGLHIIDIKLNNQQIMDTTDDEQPINENDLNISKEDVVLFTLDPTNNEGKQTIGIFRHRPCESIWTTQINEIPCAFFCSRRASWCHRWKSYCCDKNIFGKIIHDN